MKLTMSHQHSLSVVLSDTELSSDVVTGTLAPSAFRRAVDAWIGGGPANRLPSSSLLLLRIDWPTTEGRRSDRPSRKLGADVLRTVADLTSPCLRAGDVIGRVDADTLGILLPSTTSLQAEQVGRRVRAAISERSPATGHPVTVSIGMSADLLDAPWQRTTQALAEAQRAGGDCTVVASLRRPERFDLAA